MKQLLITIAAVLLVGCGNVDEQLVNAAQKGDLEAVKQAIADGANLDMKEKWTGRALLHQIWSKEVAEILILNGANIEVKNRAGYTPLFMMHGNDRKEIVKLLIESGANVNAVGSDGLTPLLNSIKHGQMSVIQLLIDKGANVNSKATTYVETPLLRAIFLEKKEVVKLLIENGANVDTGIIRTQLRVFNPPLHHAVAMNHKEIVELLIKGGADVNAHNSKGYTPLDSVTTNLLYSKDTDVNTKDDIVFHIGSQKPINIPDYINASTEIANLLRKNGGKTAEELKAEGK